MSVLGEVFDAHPGEIARETGTIMGVLLPGLDPSSFVRVGIGEGSSLMTAAERAPRELDGAGEFARLPRPARWATALLVVMAFGCGPSIEQDPPIPEHRIEPCETWCAMMFDPVCPAQEVEVETEARCVEGCSHNEVAWGYDEGDDVCAEIFVPYIECLAMLSCNELQTHFALTNMVPTEEQSSCGGHLQAHLDCQLPYQ